jgi:hypothetical protein
MRGAGLRALLGPARSLPSVTSDGGRSSKRGRREPNGLADIPVKENRRAEEMANGIAGTQNP